MSDICKSCSGECRPSFVYVMEGRDDGSVKIGYARDAKKRAYQLRRTIGNSIQLAARFKVKCEFRAMEVEDATHERLASKWTGKGEWFSCSVTEAVAAITAAIGVRK